MARQSIRARASKNMDIENFESKGSLRLTAQQVQQIASDRIDALELEGEVGEAVELLTDLKEVSEDIIDTVEETLENIDDMSTAEVMQTIGKVEAKVEELGETTEDLSDAVDSEALENDPKAVARVVLGACSDKAVSALAGSSDAEGFLDVFKSAESKLKETAGKTKTWKDNSDARISDLNGAISGKTTELKEGADAKSVGSKLGTKLATVRASGSSLDDLVKFAGGLDTIPETKAGLTSIDTNILKFIKGFDKSIKAEDFVKATRVDGKMVGYVVLSAVDGKVGFREYKTTSIPGSLINAANAKVSDSEITIDYAKKLIATAKAINDKMNGVTDALLKEADSVRGMLSVDIENAKWAKGPLFKMGAWNWFFAIFGGAAGIAGSLIEAARDGKKTFEELSAKDKERVLRARADLTARYANDVIFGMNNLVNELLDTANAIVANYKDKE